MKKAADCQPIHKIVSDYVDVNLVGREDYDNLISELEEREEAFREEANAEIVSLKIKLAVLTAGMEPIWDIADKISKD